jgi:type IV secretion system protein VirB5
MKRTIVTGFFALSCALARAQGIPVIDVASLAQAIAQVLAWEQQYQQMYQGLQQQIQQLATAQDQLDALRGSRGLGIVNNAVTESLVKNDLLGELNLAKTREQLLATSKQQLDKFLEASRTRSVQIQSLMGRINQATDPKDIQDLTARLQAEQVMAQNEAKEGALLESSIAQRRQQIDEETRKARIEYLKTRRSNLGNMN